MHVDARARSPIPLPCVKYSIYTNHPSHHTHTHTHTHNILRPPARPVPLARPNAVGARLGRGCGAEPTGALRVVLTRRGLGRAGRRRSRLATRRGRRCRRRRRRRRWRRGRGGAAAHHLGHQGRRPRHRTVDRAGGEGRRRRLVVAVLVIVVCLFAVLFFFFSVASLPLQAIFPASLTTWRVRSVCRFLHSL